ncbi:MAG: PilW family protein [Desulfuromonadales bacterium]|nr:PilW family protein [Desulfuromonadales bacterium]
MKAPNNFGFSLVELVISMAIAAIIGSMLLSSMLSFQSRTLAEIDRDDLHKRAERLLRFAVDDLRDTALLIGARPRTATGPAPVLVHDSLPGDPHETMTDALLPEYGDPTGHDAVTILKAISFSPHLMLAQAEGPGTTSLTLDRHPNRAPGSSREILPAPEAISHVVLGNHKVCYQVLAADQTLQLNAGLLRQVPAGIEVLGLRAHRLYLQPFEGSNRFYRDNFTSREILDACIDGMQLEYLMKNGHLVDEPGSLADVRGIRISLLVRSRQAEPSYLDSRAYTLGDRTYGPFFDHFRRIQISELVEIKNHGLS